MENVNIQVFTSAGTPGVQPVFLTKYYTMEDPKSYQQVNSMQHRDIEATLQEQPPKWKEKNARIMDIGCGDGSATISIWKKHIPENHMKIVGSDKSQACVDFARESYGSKRVSFMKLDIENEINDELTGYFDHIVSSYTFHWVQNQEKAFSNIYKMLAKDGTCLLIFLGNTDVYDYYRKLSQTTKWNADLKNMKTLFLSPYHDSQDPQFEIRILMKKIGFQDIEVKVHNKTYDYEDGVNEFRDLMKCLNRFEGLEQKWEDFMDDYVKLNSNAGTTVYQLLVVSGRK